MSWHPKLNFAAVFRLSSTEEIIVNDTDHYIEQKEANKESSKLRLWKAEIATARMAFSESNFKDAERLVLKAMNISDELEESRLAKGVCHFELGMIYGCSARKPQGLKEFDKAISIASETNDVGGKILGGLARIHQARIYFDLNENKRAVELLRQAIKVLNEAGNDAAGLHIATALCDLGGLYLSEGNYEDARPVLKEARLLTTLLVGSDSPAYLRAVGFDDIANSDPSEAYALWITAAARARYQTGAKHPMLQSAITRLSRIAKQSGRSEELLAEIYPELKPGHN